MKEHPILFSTDMVKAILDGRKTQTRRVISLKGYSRAMWDRCVPHNGKVAGLLGEPYLKVLHDAFTDNAGTRITCPYGQVGDRLWVRETFTKRMDGVDQILFKAQYDELVEMFADSDNDRPDWLPKPPAFPKLKWRPSIHMLKKDARIWLEITEVRVARVAEISEADAEAEGVITQPYNDWVTGELLVPDNPIAPFSNLWDSLNAKRGYGWDTNPWCWVLSFKKVEGSDAYKK